MAEEGAAIVGAAEKVIHTYPLIRHQSVRCLAVGGRFLEIGKLDLSNNTAFGKSVFLKNTTFHGILLDALFGAAGEGDDKAAAARHRVRERELEPAFRYMAAGKHIGKHSDMSEEMRIEAMELSVTACEKYSQNNELAARMVKESMDKKFGPAFHVVVGESYGFEITYECTTICYMYFGGNQAICIWKCS